MKIHVILEKIWVSGSERQNLVQILLYYLLAMCPWQVTYPLSVSCLISEMVRDVSVKLELLESFRDNKCKAWLFVGAQ